MEFVLNVKDTEAVSYNVSVSKVATKIAYWLVAEHPIFILRSNDKIVGCVILREADIWWDDEMNLLSTALIYVLPDFRSMKNFISLLDAAKEYGKIKGHKLVLDLVYVERLDVKEKLLKRYGYNKIGASFLIE